MLGGGKTAELRRQQICKMASGDKVWLYATEPVASIVGYGIVKSVETMSVAQAWREHRAELGITKREYDTYTAAKDRVCLVFWDKISRLDTAIALADAKTRLAQFTPPQFYAQFIAPAWLKRRPTTAIESM